MPHNCCVPQCHKRGYRSLTIDGIEAKVSFHTFPHDSLANRTKRRQWIYAIQCENTLSLVNGQRSAHFTSGQQIFTTTGVVIKISEKMQYPQPSPSTPKTARQEQRQLVDCAIGPLV